MPQLTVGQYKQAEHANHIEVNWTGATGTAALILKPSTSEDKSCLIILSKGTGKSAHQVLQRVRLEEEALAL